MHKTIDVEAAPSRDASPRSVTRRDTLKGGLALGAGFTASAFAIIGRASAAPIIMRFGSDSPISAPHTKAAVVMKQLVEARASGRIQVTIFPDGQLGDGPAMLNSIKTGSLDAVSIDAGSLSVAVPAVDVASLPFLFKGIPQAIAFLNSPVGMKLWPKINKAFNCEVMGWAADGSADFLTSARPIRTPADVVGLRFGLGPSAVQRDFILALGGIPSVVQFHELYTSLQTGLIDALTRNPIDMVQFKLYQVTKYLSLTRNYSLPNALVVSAKFLAKLSPQDQEIVRAAGKSAVEAHVATVLSTEQSNLTLMREHGIQIIQVENLKPFADKMQAVYKEQAPRIGADIIEAARKFTAT